MYTSSTAYIYLQIWSVNYQCSHIYKKYNITDDFKPIQDKNDYLA